MKNFLITAAGCLAIAVAVPAAAQMSGDMTQTAGSLSAADYVKMAADSDNFEIQSGRLAATKSHREDVKGFGKQMVADHTASTRTLMAALNNQDRKIAPPSTRLSSDKQAKLDLLRKAPRASFDQLYLQQQLESHRSALALHQGYAANGTDPALKQVATTIAPTVQQHLSSIQGMMGSM
jgi:putative membrane protein